MRNNLMFLLLGTLCSCGSMTNYTIDGVVSNEKLEGKTVYLCKYIGRELTNLDSTKVVDGKFQFDGTQDTAALRVLRIDDENVNKLSFILENGDVYATLDSLSSAEGTPLNDTLVVYKKAITPFETEMENLTTKADQLIQKGLMNDSVDAALAKTYAEIEKQMESVSVHFIERNLDNVAGAYIFWQNRGTFTPDLQQTLLNKAGEKFKADQFVQIIVKRLSEMKNVVVGKHFVDLTMQTPEGKTISLSDFAGKGNVVLIDFWASWCGPCRQSIPNLIKVYSKYKSRGFEIVGVSFDKTKVDWLKGIKDLGIVWPQMSDLSYWSSKGASKYAVRSIPHTVLLDKNGTIVANDLEGKELETKLDELLK
ncbi:MAG: redoxin domain-containing protein [Bacteroidales bacterium]